MPKNMDQWLKTLEKEFSNESDRAAVILIAALIDEKLKLLLKTRFVPSPTNNEEFFRNNYDQSFNDVLCDFHSCYLFNNKRSIC